MASLAIVPTSPPPITSAPSTPTHRWRSRSKSPISDGRFDLTPRSKIKALLAGFDDSDHGDNGDNGGGSPRAGVEANRPRKRDWDVRMDGGSDDGDDDEQDDEGVVEAVRRRRRRMRGSGEAAEGWGKMEVDGERGREGGEEVPAIIKRSQMQKTGSSKSKSNTRKNAFSYSDAGEGSDSAAEGRSKLPTDEGEEGEENDPTLHNAAEDSFDEDLPENHLANPRFAALVAKKRKERKAKEAAEAAKVAARRALAAELENDGDDSDSEGVRALESSTRPRQKRAAGKKAMEDMARETARLARGMQLAHEAKTKRKFGKGELFAKFGFRQPKAPAGGGGVAEKQPEVKEKEATKKEVKTSTAQDILNAFGVGDLDDIPPSTATEQPKKESTPSPSSPPAPRIDKGKGRAIDPPTPKHKLKKEFKLPAVKVDFSKYPITIDSSEEGSDIEIIDPTKLAAQAKAKTDQEEVQRNSRYMTLQARKLATLEAQQKEKKSRESARKEAAILDLRKRAGNTRALVNKSPNQKAKSMKMNPKMLAATLLQQSRKQAIKDREEKIAELVAKGVYIPTKEEMMKMVDSVEEQMEKARLEAERIKKREMRELRLEAIKRGETVPDEDSDEEEYVRESEDDEEDGDWAEEEGQEGLYELSGESEEDILESGEEEGSGVEDFSDVEKEEEQEMEGGEMGEEDVQVRSAFVADEAGEDEQGEEQGEEEAEEEGEEDGEEEEDNIESRVVIPKTRKLRRIIHDDNSDEETTANPDVMDLDPTSIPSTPAKPKNPFATFVGFDEAPMGLTQMFQSTIADSDSPKSPSASRQMSKNPFAAFPDIDNDAPLGLTQVFAGTLADDSQDPVPFTLSMKMPEKHGFGVSRLDVLRKMPVNALGNSQAPRGWGGAGDRENEKEGVEELVRETQIESDNDMQVDLTYNQSQTPPRLSESDNDGDGGETQKQRSFPKVDLRYTQSQIHTEEDSYNTNTTGYSATQSQSQWPNPTPDIGFEYSEGGMKRFDTPKPTQTQATQPIQTQDTLVDPTQQMSPLPNWKNKKPRRLLRAVEKEAEEEGEGGGVSSDDDQSNAFALMKKAAKAQKRQQALDAFNKKTSEAKTLVHEQAEESEDEWAGIGGADEPDSDDSDADEKVRKELGEMLDDNTKIDHTKERSKLEAFYAAKEREADARNVTRLFKDLQNGGLRRKRGAGAAFDVSDEEDEEERRRAVRRRNEARLRRLLLEDKEVGRIAENPKRKAFLECLQDNEGDEQGMFLDMTEDGEDSQALDTPMGEKEVVGGEGRGVVRREAGRLQREDSVTGGSDSDAFSKGPRLPKARVGGRRKNVGLAEIRSQLSFLVEDEEREGFGLSDLSDDDHLDLDNDNDNDNDSLGENLIGAPDAEGTAAVAATTITTTTTTMNPRRKTIRTATVVDRIMLKRTATLENTTTNSNNNNTTSKLAFHNSSDADPATFRIPGLLRRATATTQLDAGGVAAAAAAGVEGPVKRSGAKGTSSISYHARERPEGRGGMKKTGGGGSAEEVGGEVEVLKRRRRKMELGMGMGKGKKKGGSAGSVGVGVGMGRGGGRLGGLGGVLAGNGFD